MVNATIRIPSAAVLSPWFHAHYITLPTNINPYQSIFRCSHIYYFLLYKNMRSRKLQKRLGYNLPRSIDSLIAKSIVFKSIQQVQKCDSGKALCPRKWQAECFFRKNPTLCCCSDRNPAFRILFSDVPSSHARRDFWFLIYKTLYKPIYPSFDWKF